MSLGFGGFEVSGAKSELLKLSEKISHKEMNVGKLDKSIAKEISDVKNNEHINSMDSSGKYEIGKNDITRPGADSEGLSLKEKQEIADNVAKKYNAEKNPFMLALNKGLEGVTKTRNDGISFADSPYIYTTESGKKAIVTIEATGSRSKDFDAANKALGLSETPEGYVWHHVDNYNVKDGSITLELVKDDAHNAAKPHSGGCAQYDAVNGPSYNPARKQEVGNV